MAAWGWATDSVDKPAALRAMRHSLRRWLALSDVGSEIDELVLVASELATNAIEASVRPTDPVAVQARIDGEVVAIVVSNVGPSFVPPSTLPGDPTAASGRGLVIVRSLTERVQVRQDGRYVVVSAWRRLGTPA